MSYVIRAENVGKKYLISHQPRERYEALRDVIAGVIKHFGRRQSGRSRHSQQIGSAKEEFWALKGLDMEIRQGDRVGIVGRNGAGKSTLLKVLSRITEPSSGRIRIRGRIASLLEVGTGFHPELTGRENIFLNGAILGMTKAEITRKFEQIVDFSEVEKFLDTPVKRYSSGMYVRLAFSVAAHIDPEILIVDEVLAVGDAAFQKKCLGKMGDVSREGRTVLFVSHNMSAVRQLCERGIVLDGGAGVFDGAVDDAIDHYQNRVLVHAGGQAGNPLRLDKPSHDIPIWIEAVSVVDHASRPSLLVEHADPFTVLLDVVVETASRDYYSALLVHDNYGNNIIFSTDEDLSEPAIAAVDPGKYRYAVRVPGGLLRPGLYSITPVVCLQRRGKVDRRDAVIRFEVQDTKTRRGTKQLYRVSAMVAPEMRWALHEVEEAQPL